MPSARPTAAVDREDDFDNEAPAVVGSLDFIPSAQQQAIFDWFERGSGNLVVRARAGTGKTTTILRAIDYAPEDDIILCAFNKRIQEELDNRLRNPKAHAQTLHSLGFQYIRENWGRVRVADRSDRVDALAEAVCPFGSPDYLRRMVARLLNKTRELVPLATSVEPIIDCAIEFDLLPEPWSDITPQALARLVLQAMDLAAKECPHDTGIDYPDMVFLPLRNNWLHPTHDLVVADEAQDLTMPQLEIARRVCSGRLVLVGDDRQGIYRFRGADAGSLDRLKAETAAHELGLTTTYRCPSRIVEKAQHYVPDYQAAPSAPLGIIEHVDTLEELCQMALPGDFILSRKNAPLMGIALRLLREGIPARVQGKDIGAGLKSIVRRLATGHAAHSLPEFLSKLRNWEQTQVARLQAMGKEDRIEALYDKGDTLRALAQDARSVEALVQRIDSLFADYSRKPQVVCSTVHKAKGLESRRVFVLRSTLHPKLPCACGHYHKFDCKRCGCLHFTANASRRLEEDNIAYVAITRAKENLTWVTCPV